MTSEVFVSAGVVGASDKIGFLERLPYAHDATARRRSSRKTNDGSADGSIHF